MDTLLIWGIILIIAMVFKLFLPSKINCIYGYRTKSSMKNQETWNEAHKYSSTLLVKAAVLSLLIGAMCGYLLPDKNGLKITVLLFVLILILTIVFTEIYLKKNFDMDGKRK